LRAPLSLALTDASDGAVNRSEDSVATVKIFSRLTPHSLPGGAEHLT